MTDDQSTKRPVAGANRSRLGRRRFIAVGGGIGTALIAGCTSSDTDGTDGGSGDGDGDGSDGDAETDGGSEDSTDDSTAGTTGTFRLLISDAPADIDDFDSLEVTFDSARIFDGGGEGEEAEGEETEDGDDSEETEDGDDGANGEDGSTEQSTDDGGDVEDGDGTTEEEQTGDGEETDGDGETADGDGDETDSTGEDGSQDGSDDGTGDGGDGEDGKDGGEGGDGKVERKRGFYWLDLENSTVDLTKVVGDKAEPVFEGSLEAGTYNKIELHVADVAGVVGGEAAEVKVPSEKLQITNSFTVEPDQPLDFVFDINVVKRGQGNSYNLTPVISGSGVNGEDVSVEEVDEDEEGEDDSEGGGDGEDGADSGDSDGEAGDEDGTDEETNGDGTDSEDGEDGGPPDVTGGGGQ